MNVEAVMTRNPLTAAPDTNLDQAMVLMEQHALRHLPVVREGRLVGIVSNRDLLEATGWGGTSRPIGDGATASRSLQEVMRSPVISVGPLDTVVTASLELVLGKIGSLPVVEAGRLVGILTERDLLESWLEGCEAGAWATERDAPIHGVITRNLLTLSTKGNLGEALALCRSERINHLPVAEGGELKGFLSDRDLRQALGRKLPESTPLTQLMKSEPYTKPDDATLYEVGKLMYDRRISGVPITSTAPGSSASELVGLVTLSDLVAHCMETLREPDQAPPG